MLLLAFLPAIAALGAEPPVSIDKLSNPAFLREVDVRQQMRCTGVIRQLKADQRARENPATGMVEPIGTLSPWAATQIREENADRQVIVHAAMRQQKLDEAEAIKRFAFAIAQEDKDFESKFEDKVVLRIHGSSTLGVKLLPELAKAFLARRNYESVAIIPDDPAASRKKVIGRKPGEVLFDSIEIVANGNREGIQDLADGRCHLAMSTNVPSKDGLKGSAGKLGNLESPERVKPIALDGLAVIVHESNTRIARLTVPELTAIFSGEIKDWSRFGGRGAINLHALADEAGSQAVFRQMMERFKARPAPAHECKSAAELRRAIADDELGIGLISMSEHGVGVRVLPIASGPDTQELLPSRINIRQGYPLRRELYLVLPLHPDPLAEEFLKFVTSAEGQSLVRKLDFVDHGPTTLEDRKELEQRKKALLESPRDPAYRELIRAADRHETPADIRFDYRSADLQMNTRINVTSQVDLLRLVEAMDQPANRSARVLVIGHTDRIGTDVANKKLGLERARAVETLLRQLGIPTVPVTEQYSFGAQIPVGDNSYEDGRALNRRVELWVLR